MFNRRFSALCGALLLAYAWLALSGPAVAQVPRTPAECEMLEDKVDDDCDGLIEIYTLEDLHNIRYDLAGASYKTSEDDATPDTSGCPTTTSPHEPGDGADPITSCYGYELMDDLNFDANGNGPDAADPYYNDGDGWEPIGTEDAGFEAVFEGNGHAIANLFIHRSLKYRVGLFGDMGSNGKIRNLGVVNADVTGTIRVGSLVGFNEGNITASFAVATVSGNDFVGGLVGHSAGGVIAASYAVATVLGNKRTGGLVGFNIGPITASYAVATVSGNDWVGGLVGLNEDGYITASSAVATVSGNANVGGLAGENRGRNITASYAVATVSATGRNVGGLVGFNYIGHITASYAAATVSGIEHNVGGLVGWNEGGDIAASYAVATVARAKVNAGGLVGLNRFGEITASYALAAVTADKYAGGLAGDDRGDITASYFDADIAGLTAAPLSKTTDELQLPTTPTGIYSTWTDGSWNFGGDTQYPGLVLPQAEAGACPAAASARVMVETTADRCIHRPAALFILRFGLVAADDTGSSAADRITNQARVRLTGWVTLSDHRDILVVSMPDRSAVAEIIYDDMSMSTNVFTTEAIMLTEGLNRFAVFARRSGETDYAGPFGELKITLETEAPSLTVFRTAASDSAASYEMSATASDSSALSVAYGQMTGTDSCDIDFDAQTDYPLTRPRRRIEVSAGNEYCFVATDVAGNKAAFSTVEALILADADGNGLIEIDSLADLHDIRYNLAGTSHATSATSSGGTGNAVGCPTPAAPHDPDGRPDSGDEIDACYGYELTANLDFDPENDGHNDGDPYWNDAAGWAPIGTYDLPFNAVFDGNGHTISNLFVNRGSENDIGLFGRIKDNGEIRNLGVVEVDVTGNQRVGGLVGHNGGEIISSYALATASGNGDVGGLAGYNVGEIVASYAVATVAGADAAGGLAGAMATVNGSSRIAESYAVATVSGGGEVGGLVGENFRGAITASYFDAISGLMENSQGRSSDELQLPTADDRTEIYSTWNDARWDFGEATQYPGLILPKPSSGDCPTAASADLVIETGDAECIHRPVPLLMAGFDLVAADDTGSSAADRVTNRARVRLTGRVTLPDHRDILVVSMPGRSTAAEIIYDSRSISTNVFTTEVLLEEGLNRFAAFARRSGETDYAGAFGELEITLETEAPSLTVSKTAVPDSAASYEMSATASDSSALSVAYGEMTGTDGCDIDFDALTDYPLTDPPRKIEVGAENEYCFVATDVAGNKAAFSTAGTPILADADGNGLIEIDSLADLHNIRYNLAGTSSETASVAGDGNMNGCPTPANPHDPDGRPDSGDEIDACYGYELTANLDFDPENDGHNDGDPYWNDAAGWAPIGTDGSPFAATFDGNGYVISNLFIDRSSEDAVGLFGRIEGNGEIRNLGVVNADVTGNRRVGGLAGHNDGEIIASYAVATVSADGEVGGLAGANGGNIAASYALTMASGNGAVGGLAGHNDGEITASYAVATVSGNNDVGGLAGANGGNIAASYALTMVSGDEDVGGLAGQNNGAIAASYFDADIIGLAADSQGKTTRDLQLPTTHTGIYSTWTDGSWNFGSNAQYPGLVLSPLASGLCSATVSANVAVETMGDECIHRPASLRITEFKLLEDDDSGSTNTDSITNIPNPRITGQIALPESSTIRIVSRLTSETILTATAGADDRFTQAVDLAEGLAEGLNLLEAFVRRPGDTEDMGLLGTLAIILDTTSPTLTVFRDTMTNQFHADVADANLPPVPMIRYEQLAHASSDTCTQEHYSGRDLTGLKPYAQNSANAGDRLLDALVPDDDGNVGVYCFVAEDLAGNRTVASSADAMDFVGALRLRLRLFLESALP